MDKKAVHAALHAALTEQLNHLKASAAAAREGATHEEAKPENEYDTRALEQSYLAGAQTARAENLAAGLASLENMEFVELNAEDRIVVGACIEVDDGERSRNYYLCVIGGGIKLEVDKEQWTVLTPNSPLGKRFLGRQVGDVIEHTVRGAVSELEILAIR